MKMLLRTVCVLFFVHFCIAAPNSYNRYDVEDSRENSITAAEHQQHPFDLLIFTQRWPITSCVEWREAGKDHFCGLPKPATMWTVHGIWPTKYNTIGPVFCNKSAIFDVSELTPIVPQLEALWVNVEKNKPDDTFWEHEWLKHGTCAAETIEQLNTEMKYFSLGLAWLQQHSVNAAFAASGDITPGFNYSLTTLNKALFDYYGKDVAIECLLDRKTHQQLLNEVRICFDKQLQPTDCDGIVGLERVVMPKSRVGTVITNCNADKPIFYPDTVPKKEEETVQADREVVYETVYEISDGKIDVEVILV